MTWTCDWCDETQPSSAPDYGRDGEHVCRYCIYAWSDLA